MFHKSPRQKNDALAALHQILVDKTICKRNCTLVSCIYVLAPTHTHTRVLLPGSRREVEGYARMKYVSDPQFETGKRRYSAFRGNQR